MGDFFANVNIWMLMSVPASLLAIMLHEVSHGIAANLLGDETAKTMNRISFNPIRHVDPIGLLLLITVGFGWAKPVPVDSSQLRNPKRDMAIIAFAGPASNFLLTLFCVWAMRLTLAFSGTGAELAYAFFAYTAIRSAGLGVFNLIPVPPLDGSKILGALLPKPAYYFMLRYERFGMILLLGLMFLPRLFETVGLAYQSPIVVLIDGAMNVAYRAAGLYKPLSELLGYLIVETGVESYRIIDLVLGLEPSDSFELLKWALG